MVGACGGQPFGGNPTYGAFGEPPVCYWNCRQLVRIEGRVVDIKSGLGCFRHCQFWDHHVRDWEHLCFYLIAEAQ